MIRKASEIDEQTPWQEMTPGGEIYEGGTSRHFFTGDWRTKTPVWKPDACTQCLLCALYCPDAAIPVRDGKRQEFDYDHCKGCGVCAGACPLGAIEFGKEDA